MRIQIALKFNYLLNCYYIFAPQICGVLILIKNLMHTFCIDKEQTYSN